MQIGSIQTGNYFSKQHSQPIKPQKSQNLGINAKLSGQPTKDTVSFSGWFTHSRDDYSVADEKRDAAIRERYGNTEISRVAPEIITVAKTRLQEMGFQEIDDNNIHLINEDAPEGQERSEYNIITYYDKKHDATVRFTNDGDFAYMAKYRYTPNGKIVEHYFYRYYDFNTKEWHELSKPTSSIILP